jgi:hypothetical protein
MQHPAHCALLQRCCAASAAAERGGSPQQKHVCAKVFSQKY